MGRTTPVLNYDKTATISASATTSAAVDLDGSTICGIFIPTGFEGTTITFEHASATAGTFVAINDVSGAAISATVAAGNYVALDPVNFAGVRFLKAVSGATETSQRVLTLAVRAL